MRRLAKDDIHYLAFEGGGGAGNVFPGALQALWKLGILAYDPGRPKEPWASLNVRVKGVDWRVKGQVQGFSGASAGAINSLFLSLGYTPDELDLILKTNDFIAFFDTIQPGLVPAVGGFRQGLVSYDWGDWLRDFGSTAGGAIFDGLDTIGLFAPLALARWSGAALGQFSATVVAGVLATLLGVPDAVLRLLMADLDTGKTQASLIVDYGVFPGFKIRQFFARYVSLAVERILRDDPRYDLQPMDSAALPSTIGAGTGLSFKDPVTGTWVQTSEINFRQHQSIFGVALRLTGSNLETMKSEIFSAETTPEFRVVDAVRISMSLPVIFKPMVIKDPNDLRLVIPQGYSVYDPQWSFLKGVWVDGGLIDNIPVTAFDAIAGSEDRTLGLRLSREKRAEIDSFVQFLKVWPLGMMWGTGESLVSTTTVDVSRLIILDTYDPQTDKTAGLMDFTLDPDVYKNLNDQSYRLVMRYFRGT